jgi:hypothetical protein
VSPRATRPPSTPEAGPLDALLAAHVETALRLAASDLARPLYVTQRSVETMLGLPAVDFLEDARSGAFPSWKVRRLVFAKTLDVAAYIEGHGRPVASAGDDEADRADLARIGGRRVA